MKRLKLILGGILCFIALAYPRQCNAEGDEINLTLVVQGNSIECSIGNLDTMYDLLAKIKYNNPNCPVDTSSWKFLHGGRSIVPAFSFAFLDIKDGDKIFAIAAPPPPEFPVAKPQLKPSIKTAKERLRKRFPNSEKNLSKNVYDSMIRKIKYFDCVDSVYSMRLDRYLFKTAENMNEQRFEHKLSTYYNTQEYLACRMSNPLQFMRPFPNKSEYTIFDVNIMLCSNFMSACTRDDTLTKGTVFEGYLTISFDKLKLIVDALWNGAERYNLAPAPSNRLETENLQKSPENFAAMLEWILPFMASLRSETFLDIGEKI